MVDAAGKWLEYKERSYKDKQTGEIMRCPSCSEPNCWSSNFFTSWQNGTMDYDLVVSIFNSSHTPDFSDVLGLYKPSKDDLQSYSVPPKEFLRTCSYDRRPCSYKLFYSWNSDQYGKCHTFNSAFRRIELKNGKVFNAIPWKTSSVGPRNGMRLTLSIMTRNYLTLLSPKLGAKIIVHSPRHIPFPEDEGFNISPGISVSKRIERVGQPWGTCESSKDTQKEYSSLQCKKLCQEKEFWKVCGCYVGESPAYGDVSKLRPANQCSPFNVTQSLLNCKCPPPCNETVYSTQVTSSEENKGFYTIVQNIKRADMGDDLCSGSENETVRVHLYLESLNYEVIRESPAYTWDTLICNMGGNLGLFIGMSLVTLVELLEFLIDIGILCFSGRKKTRPEAKRVEVKPASTRPPPPPAQAPGLPPVSPPPEFTECSTQTHVSLQPFSKDKTWKRRALGGNDGAGKAFNRIFMSQ
ncbi:putative degenerin deg-1 [Penaeus vannamei]|uniref:Putative degenerin deg-1 n=1 Tax=Penaeus vannamei TaxID=6689 RepID=A0A3R7M0Z9_PENVA|nr:putative degenerin deg-1 [Penaeus vannamei]